MLSCVGKVGSWRTFGVFLLKQSEKFLNRERLRPTYRVRPGSGRGSTMAEFAIVLPMLLFLTGGAIEWGALFLKEHQVTKVIWEQTRSAALNSGIMANPAARTAVTNATDVAIGAGTAIMTCNPVQLSGPTPTGSGPQMVSLSVNCTYNFTFMRVLGIASVSFTRSSSYNFEFV